ncbi:muconate cycloisomerase [Shimia marina]|nr:muconate cycloisomerase [Shimia marina]
MSEICIESLTVTRINVPLTKPILMAFGAVSTAHILLVRMRDRDGVKGVGEATVLGGPHWNEESAESALAIIETYLAPAIKGVKFSGIEALSDRLFSLVRRNSLARSAIEKAALDLIGRRLGVPISDLLGGRCRQEIPVAWTLSNGSAEREINDGEEAIEKRAHACFKLKFGHADPSDDIARARKILNHFSGRARVIADVNQGWDEVTAARAFPALQEAGLLAIEQPLPAGNLEGIARLRHGLGFDVIADEAAIGPEATFKLAAARAASAVSLKPSRDGGLLATKRTAAIADAAGMKLYGGGMIETSVGTAASAHVYATVPKLTFGCELFGPLKLVEDIVQDSVKIKGGALKVPESPGLGVELDEEKIARLVTGEPKTRVYLAPFDQSENRV